MQSIYLRYTDGAFVGATMRAIQPWCSTKLRTLAHKPRQVPIKQAPGRHELAHQCALRVAAIPEGLLEAPVAEGIDPEEQETFETGVGLVEPVEEDEAEVGLPVGLTCSCHCFAEPSDKLNGHKLLRTKTQHAVYRVPHRLIFWGSPQPAICTW